MTQLVELLQTHGYALVLAAVLIEQIGVPLPAFPVLVVAGALVADGTLSGPTVLALAVLAALAGDLVWFQFGRRFGGSVVGWLCRLPLTPDGCAADAGRVFDRFGLKALLVTRFVPGLAAVAPTLAGHSGHRRLPFAFFDAAGGAIWAGAALAIGFVFHREVDQALAAIAQIGAGALLVLAALLAALAGWTWRRRRTASAPAAPPEGEPSDPAALAPCGGCGANRGS